MTPEDVAAKIMLGMKSGCNFDICTPPPCACAESIATAIREAVKDEREACAKIAEDCASAFEEAAAKKARTTLNRVLNEIGSADCKHVAQKIRERA